MTTPLAISVARAHNAVTVSNDRVSTALVNAMRNHPELGDIPGGFIEYLKHRHGVNEQDDGSWEIWGLESLDCALHGYLVLMNDILFMDGQAVMMRIENTGDDDDDTAVCVIYQDGDDGEDD